MEIEVEVDSDIDAEILATLVKGASDGVEAGLDFNLGGSRGDFLDRVLFVSGGLLRKEDEVIVKKDGSKKGDSTHDGGLELSHDADNIGRVGWVSSNSLDLEVRVGDGGSKDRSEEGKGE